MAFNQIALQTLNSPRLKPINIGVLSKLTTEQLRTYLAAEQYELGQLNAAIISESRKESGSKDSTPVHSRSLDTLSERQALVRQIQQIRQQKIEAAAQLEGIRKGIAAGVKGGKAIERAIKKEQKRKAKIAKQEAKKDKLWEKKNIRKGSISGDAAHGRFTRFFDSKKWSNAEKDRMRQLMDDMGVYESDEVFQLLSLLSSGAFNTIEEAEEFLNDFYNQKYGRETNIQKMEEDTRWSYEQKKEAMEALSKEGYYAGPGIHMTF